MGGCDMRCWWFGSLLRRWLPATDPLRDDPTTGEEEPRGSRGVRVFHGGDIRLPNLTITFGDDSEVDAVTSGSVELRTDMWPFWLDDVVEAAATACSIADQYPALVAQLDTDVPPEQIVADIDRLLFRELRASMRAITACAFAIDAFYAMLQERCGPHPSRSAWQKNRTARKTQVTETIRYHFKLKQDIDQLESVVSEMFRYRGYAVHPAADFHRPYYRADVRLDLDWRFEAFRRHNAVAAARWTLALFDRLVWLLDRREELREYQRFARKRMDDIFAAYEQINDGLPKLQRNEYGAGDGTATESG